MADSSQAIVTTAKAVSKAANSIANNSEVQQKVVSILDALQNGAVEVGHTVVKYTPDVVDAALMVTRINGLQHLFNALGLLVAFIISVIINKYVFKWIKSTHRDNDNFFPHFLFAIIGIELSILGINILNIIFNAWYWVQVFSPKLYIAKQIIDKALN